MEYPPSKRLKSWQGENPAAPDPFGDEEDFTQDDLEEIDIIASQAIVGEAQSTSTKRTFESISERSRPSKAPIKEGRKTFALGNDSPGNSDMYNNVGLSRRDATGNGQLSKDELYYRRLEEQQAELKKKLEEVEEQIMMKNGEIRVLRDSLRVANQEKEQQRQAVLATERERVHIQSEKEKELNRKVRNHIKKESFVQVESLQSELHFKEAEMNEMRSKLQSSERGGKPAGTPIRNSTKSNSPGSHAFVTKETFSAELCVRPTTSKGQHIKDGKQSNDKSDQETVNSDATTAELHHEGSVLMNLLLQHPLEPSSLGLCHLLCIGPDALPGLLGQSGYTSPASTSGSSTSSTDTKVLHRPQPHFYQHQSLAMSGLSMLAQTLSKRTGPDLGSKRTCPGALHLLPLLAYHIDLYCQMLESDDRSGKSPLRGPSMSASSDGSVGSTVEDSLSTQEDCALASMKALYHVVSESSEAVEKVLGGQEEQGSEKSHDALGDNRPQASTSHGAEKRGDAPEDQHPLVKRLIELLDPKFVSAACQKEALACSSLRIFCVLAEKMEASQLWRLTPVTASEALTQSLSMESSYRTVCLSVRFLALVVDGDEIAARICSHDYVCPLLRIFQYISSRPAKSVTDLQWSCLEVEVIRFLTKFITQKVSTWAALTDSSCQCRSEAVRTVVIVLHRQWLSIKEQERRVGAAQDWTGPGIQLLREALMLLHWLYVNDRSFSLHCLDVLHMYHQVVPAVRDTLRRIPDLSDSEELAIEELCRPEAEDVEDMDVDAGS